MLSTKNKLRWMSVWVIMVMIFSFAHVSPVNAAYTITDLGTFGGDISYAQAINEAGQVIGYAYTAGNAAAHAFVWDSIGGITDLGTLGGSESHPLALNEAGLVAGYASTAGND